MCVHTGMVLGLVLRNVVKKEKVLGEVDWSDVEGVCLVQCECFVHVHVRLNLADPNTDVWGKTAIDQVGDFLKINPTSSFGHEILTLLSRADGVAGSQLRRFKGK